MRVTLRDLYGAALATITSAPAAFRSALGLGDANWLDYAFDVTTSPTVPSTPAAGTLRLDNANPALATTIYLNETDADGIARAPEIATWDDTFATAPAILTLRSVSTPATYVTYHVTGANTDSGAYDRVAVTYRTSNGTFADGDAIQVWFSPPPSFANYLLSATAANTYQPLDADLTALAGLTTAANKIAAWTGAGAAALYDTTAYGLGILALASAAVADWLPKAGGTMTGDITTSIGTTLNNALVKIACPTPRDTYDYSLWTQSLATNVTETLLTGANGPTIRWAVATATPRMSARYTTGTRITMRLQGLVHTTSITGGFGVSGHRPGVDNHQIGFTLLNSSGVNSLAVIRFTDKDTSSTTLAAIGLNPIPNNLSIRYTDRTGTITCEYSIDGEYNWEIAYTDTEANAFSGAGAGTHVGKCNYSGGNGQTIDHFTPNVLVEA